MITLLVSSKTMALKKIPFSLETSQPLFLAEAGKLNSALGRLSRPKLKKLMHISDNLAGEVQRKVQGFEDGEPQPAWLMFSGDVYRGLDAETLERVDFEWAQDRVWTLSGMYGIARPLDGIKPYRLEAGYGLSVGGKKNLYEFWGDKIADTINDDVAINLSSEEYIKLIRKFFKGRIITPLFLQDRKSGVKFEAVHAKVARGAMARWIVKNRIDNPDLIKNFVEDNYVFNLERSSDLEPVFIRKSEGVMKIVKTS